MTTPIQVEILKRLQQTTQPKYFTVVEETQFFVQAFYRFKLIPYNKEIAYSGYSLYFKNTIVYSLFPDVPQEYLYDFKILNFYITEYLYT